MIYKSQIPIPKELERRFNAISVLLELADREFESIKKDHKMLWEKLIDKITDTDNSFFSRLISSLIPDQEEILHTFDNGTIIMKFPIDYETSITLEMRDNGNNKQIISKKAKNPFRH